MIILREKIYFDEEEYKYEMEDEKKRFHFQNL